MSASDYKYISDLVIRAQANDIDAFAELYAVTYQKQLHFACCYLKDEYLAQDAVQETYILALKNLPKLKNPELLTAWLNQINFHVCYNLNKKKIRYDKEMADFSDHIVNANMTSPSENGPEELIVKIDSEEYLMRQILKLPFTEAQVIVFKFYRNMKQEDIARLMDISRSTVKRYLASGLSHLRNLL